MLSTRVTHDGHGPQSLIAFVDTVKLYHMKLYPSANRQERKSNGQILVVIDTDWKSRLKMSAPYCIIRQERGLKSM